MPRFIPAIAVLSLALSACTGGHAAGSLPSKGPGGTATRAPRVTRESPPPAQMQVGTDFLHGVLARYCEGSRCDADAGARPSGSATATAQRLLLFVLRRAPSTASVEVLRGRTPQPVLTRALHAGTPTLAMHEDLRPGNYVIKLSAAWRGHNAVWLFGLRVPKRRD